jgi:hypothetical protein
MDAERTDLDRMLEPLRSGVIDIAGGIEPLAHDHGGDDSLSVRTAEHAGHSIRVETRYRVFIDGVLFPDPIHVNDDGTVHYHGLPQYSLPSALELCKLIAAHIPEGGLPPPIGGGTAPHPPDHGAHDHGGHDHGGHDHGGHDHGGQP